jgi:hypothetical protein
MNPITGMAIRMSITSIKYKKVEPRLAIRYLYLYPTSSKYMLNGASGDP